MGCSVLRLSTAQGADGVVAAGWREAQLVGMVAHGAGQCGTARAQRPA